MKKNLILSFVFFAISLWMASYIFMPYWAIGGFHYGTYDITNLVNLIMNIIIPFLIFFPCVVIANLNFIKAIHIARYPVTWIIGAVIDLLLILFGATAGVLLIFNCGVLNLWMGFILGEATLINILVWSIMAAIRAFKNKEQISPIK